MGKTLVLFKKKTWKLKKSVCSVWKTEIQKPTIADARSRVRPSVSKFLHEFLQYIYHKVYLDNPPKVIKNLKELQREKEIEEEIRERKKQEKKTRDKEAAYQERLRNWENRER